MIASVLVEHSQAPDTLIKIIHQTPLERIAHLRQCDRVDSADIDCMLHRYAEFLE